MSNSPNIRSILDELYQADPELRSRESELIPLIEQLLTLRPQGEPTTIFKQRLHEELLHTHSTPYPSFFQRMKSSFQLKYLAVPLTTLAIAIIVFTSLPQRSNVIPGTPVSVFPANAITRNSMKNAFGSLANAAQQNAAPITTNTMGGTREQALVSDGMDKRMANSLIAPGFELTNYKYTYKGELPTWNAQMDVYKRVKGATQNAALAQSLARTTQGLVDLTNFDGLGVQSFILSQSTPYGYNINVDLLESTVVISQNYRAWPHPEANCTDEACFQRMRVKENEIPADAELIRIANEFLQANGIAADQYAAPQVNSEWRAAYAAAKDKTNFYVPDIVTVIYPIKVDGNLAYDEGGFPYGLMVNIQARDKRVESVSNLMSNSFESSAYQTEQDQQRIRSVMEKGGVYGFSYPEAKKTVQVELQNPEIVLQKIWMPVQPGEISNELLIPAIRFEVKEKPENSYIPDHILVPLVKDVLDQIKPGDIRIMM